MFSFKNKYLNNIVKNVKNYFSSQSCFEFIGDNWNHTQENLPIAILWGFNPWKRDFTAHFLTDYKTAFVLGKKSWHHIQKQLGAFPIGTKLVFMSWSKKIPKSAVKYANQQNIECYYVEDGFIRSSNLQEKHTQPYSLCFDKKGIYFDATETSDLEELIKNYDFASNPQLTEDAKVGIELVKAMKLSKYYDTRLPSAIKELNLKEIRENKRQEKNFLFKGAFPENYYKILVLGQVEEDASILYGCHKKLKNSDVIFQARKDYPDAEIYYRPHPDVLYGNRRELSNIENLSNICTILDNEYHLHDVIQEMDHIYTITSLSGFEALLYNKKVTTLGTPFYSGWGLTIGGQSCGRRNITRSHEEVFATSYFLYPTYYHPISYKKIDFFITISNMYFEKIRNTDLFEIDKILLEYKIIEQYKNYLSSPLQLLIYLNKTGEVAGADIKQVMAIAKNSSFLLHDFEHFSYLLVKSYNFDALKSYCDYVISYVNDNKEAICKNLELLNNFLATLNFCSERSNGRIFLNLAILLPYLNLCESNNKRHSAFKEYVTYLSNNLHYDVLGEIFQVLDKQENVQDDFLFWGKLCKILSTTPTRKERNYLLRKNLIDIYGKKYLQNLSLNFHKKNDELINYTLYAIAIGDMELAKNHFFHIQKSFKKENYSLDNPSLSLSELFSNRENDLDSIYLYMLKNSQINICREILEQLKYENNEKKYEKFLSRLHYSTKNYSSFKLTASIEKNTFEIANVLRAESKFQEAFHLLKNYNQPNLTSAKKELISSEMDKLRLLMQTSSILHYYPQPKVPKGVIFVASHSCYNTLAMTIPSLVEAKKLGYAVIYLTAGMIDNNHTGYDFIDKYANIIPIDMYNPNLQNEWYINWFQKEVISNNINFYQGFYEVMSNSSRNYFIDINLPHLHDSFMKKLYGADIFLMTCKNIYREVVKEHNMPVIFLSGSSHVVPYSIVRDFCLAENHPMMSFINCNVAYESYFSNLKSKFATTMCVTDMTVYPNRRVPFFAIREKFEEWYEKNKNEQKYLDYADSLCKINRNSSNDNSKELELIEFLKEQKKNGKKILCAFGKVPIDLGVPYDGGPAHKEMSDWITHTVKVCGRSEDIILLVKPHPHELRPEIAIDLITGLSDLIKTDIPKNVKILGHKDINIPGLVPYLDLAILYNGSSSLELTAQGVPVLMAAYFGKYDYPVDLIYPESRKQYEHYLLKGDYSLPTDEIRKKAAFLICYMGSEEIIIPNAYSKRPITNDKVGLPKWDMKKIEKFLSEGDPYMEKVARQMVEKIENFYANQKQTHSKKQYTLVEAVKSLKIT